MKRDSESLIRVQSRVAAFALLVLAAGIAGPVMVCRFFRCNMVMTHKLQLIRDNRDVETVLLGSSASLVGIEPKNIPGGAISLALPAQDLYFDCALARVCARDLPNLKRIVLQISVWSWGGSVLNEVEPHRIPAYWFVFDIPPERINSTLVKNASRDAIVALCRSVVSLYKGRNVCPNPYNIDGSDEFPSDNPNMINNGATVAKKHVSAMSPLGVEKRVVDVELLIRQCRDEGIEIVLLTLPHHACYRNWIDESVLKQNQETTERLVRETGITYLNYYSDSRFTDEHFYDCDHMSPTGAKLFTSIFARDLVSGAGFALGNKSQSPAQ